MESNKAAAAAAAEGRGQMTHITNATVECVLVASQFLLSCYGVSEDSPRLPMQALIALSYVAVYALTLFARRLEAREHHGRERWLKLAARALASLVLCLLILRTDSLMAGILILIIW